MKTKPLFKQKEHRFKTDIKAAYPNGYRYMMLSTVFHDDVFTNNQNRVTKFYLALGISLPTDFRYLAANFPGRLLLRLSAVRGNTIYWAPAVNNIGDYLNY